MNYQTITQYGVLLTVQYAIKGAYVPATYYTPEENPEIIIYEICAHDSSVNLYSLLNEDQIEDIAETVQTYL